MIINKVTHIVDVYCSKNVFSALLAQTISVYVYTVFMSNCLLCVWRVYNLHLHFRLQEWVITVLWFCYRFTATCAGRTQIIHMLGKPKSLLKWRAMLMQPCANMMFESLLWN